MATNRPTEQERVGFIDIPAEWIRWKGQQQGEKGPYWTGYIPFFGTGAVVFSSQEPKVLERDGRIVRLSLRRGKYDAPKISAMPKPAEGNNGR